MKTKEWVSIAMAVAVVLTVSILAAGLLPDYLLLGNKNSVALVNKGGVPAVSPAPSPVVLDPNQSQAPPAVQPVVADPSQVTPPPAPVPPANVMPVQPPMYPGRVTRAS